MTYYENRSTMKNILLTGMQRSMQRNPMGWILGVLGVVAFFFVLYYAVTGIMTILSYVTPVLLVLTAIINYRVITSYIAMVWNLLKSNFLMGLVAVLLTAVAYPLVAGFLFFQAIVSNRVGAMQERMGQGRIDEYDDYEDISEPSEELILKQPEIRRNER